MSVKFLRRPSVVIMVRVLVAIADDSEEIETACITDVLVRAGVDVTVASVMPEGRLQCKMARGLKVCFPRPTLRSAATPGTRLAPGQHLFPAILPPFGPCQVVADMPISACAGREWDAIALPGGMPGAQHLADCAPLVAMLKAQITAGKTVAAVCAAPAVVLAAHGLLPARATSYPAAPLKGKVAAAGSEWTDARVVEEGCVITSQGPGTSLQCAPINLVYIYIYMYTHLYIYSYSSGSPIKKQLRQ